MIEAIALGTLLYTIFGGNDDKKEEETLAQPEETTCQCHCTCTCKK